MAARLEAVVPDLDFWRDEADVRARGLAQLRQLRKTALAHIAVVRADPECANDEADELYYRGEIKIVPDEGGWQPNGAFEVSRDEHGNFPTAEAIVIGCYEAKVAYYDTCIGDCKRNLAIARRTIWVEQARSGRSGPRLQRLPRARARESRPRRQRVRSGSSSASRDGPGSDSDEPPLARSSPAASGRLGVEPA
jgi:hypothetical protein